MKVKVKAVLFLVVMTILSMSESALGDYNAITVTVTGKNVNMAKTLCGEDAPVSDRNVLSVVDVKDKEGKSVEGYAGKLLHYLPEESSMALMKGDANLDKEVTVKGVLYINAQTLRVAEFELFDWDILPVGNPSQAQIL